MTFFQMYGRTSSSKLASAARPEARLERLAGGVGLRVVVARRRSASGCLFPACSRTRRGRRAPCRSGRCHRGCGRSPRTGRAPRRCRGRSAARRRPSPTSMQGMVSAMTSAVCVALTMRMTMSMVPMSCAVALVWKPVSTLLALRRAEDQPVGRDLVHVRFVLIDEPELGAALAQIGGEHAAGSAGADHCNFHAFASLANCRPVVGRPAEKIRGGEITSGTACRSCPGCSARPGTGPCTPGCRCPAARRTQRSCR